GTFTYTYNAAGRMVQAESLTTTLVYTYNAQGLRVAQSVDGDASSFMWDWASGIPEMLTDGDNLYLVGHDTLGQSANGAWGYYLPDALGSIRQTTDDVGAVSGSREWTPFGVEVGRARGGLGYTGEWLDSYTEFNYLRARWYAPQTARLSSPDPIGPNFSQPQSINRYTYVQGNPLKFTDPLGLRGIIPWGQYYWSWGRSFGEYDPDIISDLGNEDNERARGAIYKIELNFEGRSGGPPATILFLLGWLGPCASVSNPQFSSSHNYRAHFDYPGDMTSYRSQPIFPDRDYNRYDWLISGWVDYWNWRARREGKSYDLPMC
ncbi:MAG: RHS repeat-associated core domain-containing protein, partial [Chloroflexi bacterium]|nr:RHS repeat-associated core domain-containing protein [Chloroflexota bacterium]